MTTNSSKFNASAPLVKPTTEDESQPSTGNTNNYTTNNKK